VPSCIFIRSEQGRGFSGGRGHFSGGKGRQGVGWGPLAFLESSALLHWLLIAIDQSPRFRVQKSCPTRSPFFRSVCVCVDHAYSAPYLLKDVCSTPQFYFSCLNSMQWSNILCEIKPKSKLHGYKYFFMCVSCSVGVRSTNIYKFIYIIYI